MYGIIPLWFVRHKLLISARISSMLLGSSSRKNSSTSVKEQKSQSTFTTRQSNMISLPDQMDSRLNKSKTNVIMGKISVDL